MRNFKITLEYDGAHFSGWQIQKKGERTVQGEFEKSCANIFKAPVKIIASGRTDSGVHAKGQVVSFKAETRMKPQDILKALNSHLPEDCAVVDVKEVKDDFHAQYSVKEKTYRYTIVNASIRPVFLRKQAYFYRHPLNLTLMRKASKDLIGRHDFKAFQAFDPLRADKSSVRTIKKLVIKKDGNLVFIDVTANGFLYKMVRNIAGTLIAVGAGLLPADSISKILKSKDRDQAHNTAPAQGLCLMTVRY